MSTMSMFAPLKRNAFSRGKVIKLPESISSVSKWFQGDSEGKLPVKIGKLSEEFSRRFLNGKGKQENLKGVTYIRRARLEKRWTNSQIIKELNAKGKSGVIETTLTEMCQLIDMQGTGEEAVWLPTNDRVVIFTKDQFGELCAVCSYLAYRKWNFYVRPIQGDEWWDPGCIFLFRDKPRSRKSKKAA